MITHIKERLIQYEKERDVDILYACVYGSREFGHARSTSDYDIVLVYNSTSRLSNAAFKEVYNGVDISYSSWFIDDLYELLRDNSSFHWNFINAKEVLINNANNFREYVIETFPYDRRDLIKDMYYFVLSHYNSINQEQGDTPRTSGYLKAVSTLMRIRWLEDNDNLNFPSMEETLLYLNGDEMIETRALLDTAATFTIKKPFLEVYIGTQLQRIKEEWNIHD